MRPLPDATITGLNPSATESPRGAAATATVPNQDVQAQRLTPKDRFGEMARARYNANFLSRLTHPEQPNCQLMGVLRWHPRQTHVPIIRPGRIDLPDDRDDRIRLIATEAFERNAPQLWRRIFDYLDTDQWDITPILYDIVDVFEKSNDRILRLCAAFLLVY